MEATRYNTFALIILGVCVMLVTSLIEPIPLPKELQLCLQTRTSHYNISETPLHMIQSFCMSNFLSLNPKIRMKANFTLEEENYLSSLFRQVAANSWQFSEHGRFRRQSTGRRRMYRREIRSAPHSHWQRFVAAVQRLKRDRSGRNGRSRYDTIAAMHTSGYEVVHFGPSFLPWHKLYLILFETAANVPIPYWDTTIDNELDDPTQSVLWTSKYFGNGNGHVVTGPFRNYQTPSGPLMRDIGDDGSLLSKRNVRSLLRHMWNTEISEPSYDQMTTLEGQHNRVHHWVGGHTNDFEIAAYDPVFWCLHAYVDFVWEVFRGKQRRRGTDPEDDVVESSDWRFNPNRKASGFKDLRIRDGYANRYSRMVAYDPMPKCPDCGKSTDMFCSRRRNVCVSATRFNRARRTTTSRRRGKRSVSYLSDNFIRALKTKRNVDITNYVFIPVKVIRTDLGDGEIRHILNTSNHITQVLDPTCIRHPSVVHKDTIYLQSEGINYYGRYKESVKLHGSTLSYIGIQKPINQPLDVYISAYDRCGRICTPNCLVKNSYPPAYRPCTGTVRATMEEPLMFLSFESASSKHKHEPSYSDTIVPILFHCNI